MVATMKWFTCLPKKMGAVITPLMETTNTACIALAEQIGRLNLMLGDDEDHANNPGQNEAEHGG